MSARRCLGWVTILTTLILLNLLAGDRAQAIAAPSLPELTLQPGEFYFRADGTPRFIFVRNVTGYQQSHYDTVLDWAKAGGALLARVQLDSLGAGMTRAGTLEESWAQGWEAIFDKANANGIYVLPVFGVWYGWNNGAPDYGYSTWAVNPLNTVNGGPAKTPAELFKKDSATQKLWLQWMTNLVTRWQTRKNIAAWEIFSEINIATGTSEAIGIDFLGQAASQIRAADPAHRPITLSLAGVGGWSAFYQSGALDFIEIHPYPSSGQLDTDVISSAGQELIRYNKPVLIGESGLSALTPERSPATLTTAANAALGINHAIWAAIVSGAMNGRALWWEDSYAIYFRTLGFPWMEKYATMELPAVTFVKDVSFAGFKPVSVQLGAAPLVVGGAVGNQTTVIGWFRDARCEPPDWKLQPKISNQQVRLGVPGTAARWQVDFYSTSTGTQLSSITVTRQGNRLTIPLPDFKDAIAFKMAARP